MRKQFTIDDKTNDLVKRISKTCEVSESVVINYGIICLCQKINKAPPEVNLDIVLKAELQSYKKSYFDKNNPRGKHE